MIKIIDMDDRVLEIQPNADGNFLRNRTTQTKAIIKDEIEESFLGKKHYVFKQKRIIVFQSESLKRASHF